MSISLPAAAIIPGDYVTHSRCDGYHWVRYVESADAKYPGANMVHIEVTTADGVGIYTVRRTTPVEIAFSGVDMCSIHHNALTN